MKEHTFFCMNKKKTRCGPVLFPSLRGVRSSDIFTTKNQVLQCSCGKLSLVFYVEVGLKRKAEWFIEKEWGHWKLRSLSSDSTIFARLYKSLLGLEFFH